MDAREPYGGPTSGHPAGPPPRERVLRRPTKDRALFGVASGLARYFDLDPVLVRILFVLLAVFGGSGFLLYLVGLLVIPEERPGDPVTAAPRPSNPTLTVVLGTVLVVLGTIALLGRAVPALGDLLGPLLLVGVGIAVLLSGRGR